MADKRKPQSRCQYCGRFFVPDYRVKDKQKSCAREECRARRKRESQRKWVEANPGYFRGRSGNTKQWRGRHPDYQKQRRAAKAAEIQDEIRPETPVKTLRIVIPANWSEIQDTIILTRRCACGFYVGGQGLGSEIQDEIAFSAGSG